jgi:hypothetical protein
MFMKPTGLAGNVEPPACVVAESDEVKFTMFKKNCCHDLVGLLVFASKNSDCGYGFSCEEL